MFVTKDNKERQEFPTGMVRDTNNGKARYDLLDLPMLRRWAELMARGAKKYSANNWKLARTEEELERFRESAFRHFIQWFTGENDGEDHAAAVYFNIAGAEMVREKLRQPEMGKPLTKEEAQKLADEGYKVHIDDFGICGCEGNRMQNVLDGQIYCSLCKGRIK